MNILFRCFYFDNTRSVTLLYDNNLSSIVSMLTGFSLRTYFWDEYLDNAICIIREESVLYKAIKSLLIPQTGRGGQSIVLPW